MYQVFFLAVLFNALAGLILIVGNSGKDDEDQSIPGFIIDRSYWQQPIPLIVGGIASIITGVLKLLSVTNGNVLVVGDILPAGYAILQGAILLLMNASIQKEKESPVVRAPSPVLKYARFIGIGGMLVAIAHFFFHQVLFL